VAQDFLVTFPDNGDGMLRWAMMSKKILKLLDRNKDRTLRKMLDALIPQEEQSSGADNPTSEQIIYVKV
jgi:hypothetical protein